MASGDIKRTIVNKIQYQTKYKASNSSSPGDMGMSFTLEVGKTYRVTLRVAAELTNKVGEFQIRDNTTVVGRLYMRSDSASEIHLYEPLTVIVTMASTNLNIYANTLTATVRGNGTLDYTWTRVEGPLDDYEVTTAW